MRIFEREYRQPKRFIAGTHRARTPAETLADFGRHQQTMGITRLANVTGLDVIGIPVYMAMRPNSRSIAVAQGKGLDREAARVSALMESAESWHAENLDLPLRYASAASLGRAAAIVSLETLPRDEVTPILFDRPMLWVEGYDLIGERAMWVPHDCVCLDFVPPHGYAPIFPRSSNGLASGNHILEAIVHGLCEVIERDAIALWYAEEDDESAKATQIDPATIEDEACQWMLSRITDAGLRFGIWDATSDTGIPTYLCMVYDRPGARVVGRFAGQGSHLAPNIALSRAVSEAVQSRLTFIAGSRDDLYPEEYRQARNADDIEHLDDQLNRRPGPVSVDSRTSRATDTFESDISVLLDALRGIGLTEAVVVDLTHAALGIPVIKMVVPGLADSDTPGVVDGARIRQVKERRA
jgi:ribosomal protein S12 methylthiotransferase accessory factor